MSNKPEGNNLDFDDVDVDVSPHYYEDVAADQAEAARQAQLGTKIGALVERFAGVFDRFIPQAEYRNPQDTRPEGDIEVAEARAAGTLDQHLLAKYNALDTFKDQEEFRDTLPDEQRKALESYGRSTNGWLAHEVFSRDYYKQFEGHPEDASMAHFFLDRAPKDEPEQAAEPAMQESEQRAAENSAFIDGLLRERLAELKVRRQAAEQLANEQQDQEGIDDDSSHDDDLDDNDHDG